MKTLRTTLSPLSKAIAYCQRNVIRQRSDMHGYQDEGVDFIKDTPFCGLFVDLGLGKTVMAGTAAVDRIAEGTVNKVLIVGPKRVAKVGWPSEFEEWGHLCFWKISVIDGDAAQRERAAREDCHFYTVSVDNLAWLCTLFKKKWPYDMVILDESSMFKSHTSQRFKLLRRCRPYINYLVELTATPAAEGYMGIFAQTYLLDEGERFGTTITGYQENYFIQNKYNFKFKLRNGAEEEIIRKISDIVMVMKAEDYLDLKKPTPVPIPVELDPHSADLYRQMEEESLVEIMPDEFDEYLDDPVTIEAEQAASLQAKLLQLASGFIYDTKIVGITSDDKVVKQKDAYRIHDLKFDALEELLDTTLEGKNVFLAYHFKPTLARLQERFGKRGLVVMDDDGKAIKKWNAGKIKLLAAHPQSAGHGLNLQHGGHIIVYVDNPWSLERFLQFNGRLARQGQKHPVTVYQMKAMIRHPKTKELIDTVDGTVIEALNTKSDVQDAFFDLLNRIKGRITKRMKAKKTELWDDEDD